MNATSGGPLNGFGCFPPASVFFVATFFSVCIIQAQPVLPKIERPDAKPAFIRRAADPNPAAGGVAVVVVESPRHFVPAFGWCDRLAVLTVTNRVATVIEHAAINGFIEVARVTNSTVCVPIQEGAAVGLFRAR